MGVVLPVLLLVLEGRERRAHLLLQPPAVDKTRCEAHTHEGGKASLLLRVVRWCRQRGAACVWYGWHSKRRGRERGPVAGKSTPPPALQLLSRKLRQARPHAVITVTKRVQEPVEMSCAVL